MLDEGGEAAELGVLAKKIALDAVALDHDIVERIRKTVDLYSEAACLLQSQSSGLGALGRAAEAYAQRSKELSKLLESVGEAPKEPPMTEVEWDAVRFVQLRQAKAQLGFRDYVGGSRAGRHGYNFFTCMEDRDTRTLSNPGVPVHSWNEKLAFAATEGSTDLGSEPLGGSMASRIEATQKQQGDADIASESQTIPRADTLDTLNTALESLDSLKIAIDSMDAPSRSVSGLSASPSAHASKDAARQAASRKMLQETRKGTPPRASPSSGTAEASERMQSATEGAAISLTTSIASYAIGAASESHSLPMSSPAQGCRYKVGDTVEIFSKSANAWLTGSVVGVEKWLLTVRYGDRERKVDLQASCLSEFFRCQPRVSAFDSMLNNVGGPLMTIPGSEESLEEPPRHIKPAVL
jgi:hypothetical protein